MSTIEAETVNGAEVLRGNFLALRLSSQKWGARKTLSNEQRAKAAGAFDAEGDCLSAGKKLLDTKSVEWKAVTSALSGARDYWESVSLPYPERGIRLIRADQMQLIVETLQGHRDTVENAVHTLDLVYGHLRDKRARQLGDLYCESDYPETLIGAFGIDWDFPSVDPPEYLRQLNPSIYAEQCRRVEARFTQAVEMAESAFAEELAKLVDTLAGKIAGDDGRPKIFRDSAVENFREFFSRFQDLNIGSSQELENLVERAEMLLDGVSAQGLRDSDSLRARVSAQLSAVSAGLDGLLIDRPRRRIDRSEGE